MAVREIVQLGNECLKKVSEPIREVNEEALEIVKDLKDTLATVEGIGLAAPQIAVNKQVVYIDFGNGEKPIVLIDPEIISKSKETEKDYEGCLSYVGYEGLVERSKKVVVEATNEEGIRIRYEAEGLMARCFCHEIDHLKGIMYTDIATEMYELVDEE